MPDYTLDIMPGWGSPRFSWVAMIDIVGKALPNMSVSSVAAAGLRDFIVENIFPLAIDEFMDLLIDYAEDRAFAYGGMTRRQVERAQDYQEDVGMIMPVLEITLAPP